MPKRCFCRILSFITKTYFFIVYKLLIILFPHNHDFFKKLEVYYCIYEFLFV